MCYQREAKHSLEKFSMKWLVYIYIYKSNLKQGKKLKWTEIKKLKMYEDTETNW